MNIYSNLNNKELSDFLGKTLNNYYDKSVVKNLSIKLNSDGIELINAN